MGELSSHIICNSRATGRHRLRRLADSHAQAAIESKETLLEARRKLWKEIRHRDDLPTPAALCLWWARPESQATRMTRMIIRLRVGFCLETGFL